MYILERAGCERLCVCISLCVHEFREWLCVCRCVNVCLHVLVCVSGYYIYTSVNVCECVYMWEWSLCQRVSECMRMCMNVYMDGCLVCVCEYVWACVCKSVGVWLQEWLGVYLCVFMCISRYLCQWVCETVNVCECVTKCTWAYVNVFTSQWIWCCMSVSVRIRLSLSVYDLACAWVYMC